MNVIGTEILCTVLGYKIFTLPENTGCVVMIIFRWGYCERFGHCDDRRDAGGSNRRYNRSWGMNQDRCL